MFRVHPSSTTYDDTDNDATVTNPDDFIDSDSDEYTSYGEAKVQSIDTPTDYDEAFITAIFSGSLYANVQKALVVVVEWDYDIEVFTTGDIDAYIVVRYSTNSGTDWSSAFTKNAYVGSGQQDDDSGKEIVRVSSAAINAVTLGLLRTRVFVSSTVASNSYSSLVRIKGLTTFAEVGLSDQAASFII